MNVEYKINEIIRNQIKLGKFFDEKIVINIVKELENYNKLLEEKMLMHKQYALSEINVLTRNDLDIDVNDDVEFFY